MARHASRYIPRPAALPGAILEPLPGDLLHRRWREARRGRVLLAARPSGRRHEHLRSPSLDDGGRIRAGGPPAGCRGRRHRPAARDQGQAIAAFVTIKDGTTGSKELMEELKGHVTKKIGALARPDDLIFASDLPKTRSGKIMRR